MKEVSFGIIPLRQNKKGLWEVFLVCHRAGHWALPKGKSIDGETPFETARRELREETALTVEKLLYEEPFFEHYRFERGGQTIEKTVGYFLAQVSGEEKLQPEEIQEAKWVLIFEAPSLVTFPEVRKLLEKVQKILFII
jgi:bis(5'-nucleosidyl)-tetraphosphatase